MDKTISFIQPSRNNLKYLKWSYEAIRKNLGYRHEICMADDFSNDGTWEWMKEISKKDQNVKIHRNTGPTRLGHTILYDTLINMATSDIVMIYHADMYALPGLDEEILKHIKPGVVVSGTRIEPPLHPDGPEKIIQDFGIEPEEFQEQELLDWYNRYGPTQETTEGIFAPWAIYKEDFQKIGGHDPLFAPQSKEDSDIFNRFILAGYKVVQTRKGCVYHMTCRGSRRNTVDKAKNIYEDSPEWLEQNMRSTRNFIRKWGHFIKHDALMKPIVPPKYDIGFIVKNCNSNLLQLLEPWCSTIYIEDEMEVIKSHYIDKEQNNTEYILNYKIRPYDNEKQNEILVRLDAASFNQDDFTYIQQLSEIIQDNGEVGSFQLGNLFIDIVQMNEYQNTLITL